MLSFFESKGTSMTCICGDITQNGTETELSTYKSIVNASTSEVYTTTGNHDCTSFNKGINESLWQQYTGQQLVFEKSITRNGKVDHFLFLGMTYWYFSAAYQEHHIDWLEDKLEEYRNDRCFVFTHLFFPDRAGNMNEVYPSGNWLSGVQLYRLQEICDHYVNSVWFSGHSHWEWDLQRYEDKANIYRESQGLTSGSGWCVHVPSCGVPGISNTGTDRNETAGGSEGAIVEVYENHIDILGISLDTASGEYKYLPIATYRLDTSIQTIEETEIERESHYLKAEHFHQYKGDKSAFSVVDVEGTNYVDVIFTAASQGFYIRNETFIENVSNRVSVIVEEVKCWTNWNSTTNTGVKQETPIGNVGFYTGGYTLASTNACIVNATNGVQFQTSSSCTGPYSLKLRLKVQMVYYPSSSGEGGDQDDKYYLTASDFTLNPNKNVYTDSSGNITGPHENLPTVSDVTDDGGENYVDVKFYKKSQGFWVMPKNFPGATGKVKIIVEDAYVILKNGTTSTVPGKVGFYAQISKEDGYKYWMETVTVQNSYEKGLAFQTKSDCSPAEWPLHLRMKVRMEFQ